MRKSRWENGSHFVAAAGQVVYRLSQGFSQRGGAATQVTQSCTLPYRRFVIGKPPDSFGPASSLATRVATLQTRDTADRKSAPPRRRRFLAARCGGGTPSTFTKPRCFTKVQAPVVAQVRRLTRIY